MTLVLDPAAPASPHFSLAPFQRTWLLHASEVPPDTILLPLVRTMPGLLLWAPDDTVPPDSLDPSSGVAVPEDVLLRRFLDILLHLTRARRLSGEVLRALWTRQRTPVVRAAIFLSGELALSGWDIGHSNGSNWWHWATFPEEVQAALRCLTPAQRNAWGHRSAARAIVSVLLTNPGVGDLPTSFGATRRLQFLGLCLEDGAVDVHVGEILAMLTWTAKRADFAPPVDVLTPFLMSPHAAVRAWAQLVLPSAVPAVAEAVEGRTAGDRPGGHHKAR